MGVVNGTPVNASNTNSAFLNKNQADQMTFPASFTAALSLSKRDESSAATVNALTTTSVIVRVTGTVATINGAVAPTTYDDGQLLVISNASANTITINHESGSATATNRFALPNSTLLSIGAGQAASFYYDNTADRWRPSAGSGAGGGASAWTASYAYLVGNTVTYTGNLYICLTANTSGATFEADFALGYWALMNSPAVGKNYMAVGSNFESNSTAGWQLVTTTLASLIPTGAPTIGSAASISIGVSGTNPLSGLYSLTLGNVASTNIAAGQGIISQVFTISQMDQAKVLASRFAYKANANLSTALMNFSGTSSNTWAVYIYDVTNSAWIQPAGVYGMTQSSGVGIESATWQTPSNMTQFRLAILCVNATTGTTPAVNAYQLYFDEFFAGPQATVTGSPVTDSTSYVPTGSWTSNSTYSGTQRRVGDRLVIEGKIALSGAPNSTALSINLPSGLSVDTTKIGTDAGNLTIGSWSSSDTGVSNYTGLIRYNNTTSVICVVSEASATYLRTATVDQVTPFTWGNTDYLNFKFDAPILGWSSSTQMSNDTDTRVVDFAINPTSGITPSGTISSSFASCTTINFNTSPTKDSHGIYNNGVVTIPVSGDYWCGVKFETNGTGGSYWEICYVVNGVQVADNGIKPTANAQYVGGTVLLPNLKAGDLLTIRLRTDCTSPVFISSVVNSFSLFRLSGPSAIAASETVQARYTTATAQSISTATIVNFTTKVFDSHGAVTTGASWKFTAPISGTYEVRGSYLTAGTTAVQYFYYGIFKNGLDQSTYPCWHTKETANNTRQNANGTAKIQLLAGEYIDLRGTASGSTTALSGDAYINFIEITRVGN